MTVGTNIQCTRKCRKNECGETKSMIKEMVWNKYLQEEGLDKYPEILKLFDSDSEAIKLVTEVSHFFIGVDHASADTLTLIYNNIN
jgi:hypothetical protein